MKPIESKLPTVGTTIFTLMSQLAEQHRAVNLSQGFPDFLPPATLLELVERCTARALPPVRADAGVDGAAHGDRSEACRRCTT